MKTTQWRPETSLGGQVLRFAEKTKKICKAQLNSSGLNHLSITNVWLLNFLTNEPMILTELCNVMKQRPSSLQQMLERLEKEGLVKQTRQNEDLRKVFWSLTKKGKFQLDKAQKSLREVGKKVDIFLSRKNIWEKEIERMKEVLMLLNEEFDLEN